jgi:hypothetical protein
MEITRRRELLAAGYAPSEVRRFLRDGRLASVRRGSYTLGAPRSNPSWGTWCRCGPPCPTSRPTP